MLPQTSTIDKAILTAETRNLLAHLWRNGAYGYFWFASQDDQKYTQWAPVNQVVEPLPRHKTSNVYFGVHPSTQRGTDSQRSSIATIAAINCLFAEFDAKDYGSKDAIFSHLEALPQFPSVLIDSGGGYHGYWLLSDGYRLTDDATREHVRRVQSAWVQFVGGDPAASDLSRVLRLPGTLNRKPAYAPDFPRVEYVKFHPNRTSRHAELEQLIAPLLEPKRAPVAHRAPSVPGNGNHRASSYAQTALDGELTTLARTREGDRNRQLNESVFNLGLLVNDGLLDENDVADQLLAAALAAGLGEREASATIRSGLAAGMRGNPRVMPDFTDNSQQQRSMNGVAPVVPIAAAPVGKKPIEQPRRFSFLTPTELLNRPPRQWLIHQLLGVGDTGMIYGESGAGKTFVTVDLLLSCALGQQFAQQFEVDEPIRAAYCAGEGAGGLAERFHAAIASREVDLALLERNLTVCLDVPNLFDPGEGLYQFAADYVASGREALDLLIIDTLHAATAGSNENSTQDAGKILASIRFLQKTLGCAVLLVHHANRAGTGERGSSAFRAAMDAIIEISGNRDAAVMKCSKLKDATPFQPIAFSLVAKENSARVFWHGTAEKAEVAPMGEQAQDKQTLIDTMTEYAGTKFTCNSLAETIGKGQNHTGNLLAELVKQGACNKELSDPGRKQSNRNPWVYFVTHHIAHPSHTGV